MSVSATFLRSPRQGFTATEWNAAVTYSTQSNAYTRTHARTQQVVRLRGWEVAGGRREVAGGRRQVAGGRWQVAGG